jgi:hypothetical protein
LALSAPERRLSAAPRKLLLTLVATAAPVERTFSATLLAASLADCAACSVPFFIL